MKAISLLQPWATLWMLGIKINETRSWKTEYRGKLFVHASLGRDGEDFYNEVRPGLTKAAQSYLPADFHELPFGAIIGHVNLVDCISINTTLIRCSSAIEIALGNYSLGRYAWRAEGSQELKKLVPCKGSLSIWQVPPEVERLLAA
jgi:hypothetical protein